MIADLIEAVQITKRHFTADNDVNYCMYRLCAEVDRTSIIDAYTFDDIFLKIQNKLLFVTEYLYFRYWTQKKQKSPTFTNY